MIFKRKDGYRIKVDPFMRFLPLIMKTRNDALVQLLEEIELQPLDDYIKKVYAEKGSRLSYMHIIYSAMVQTLKEKPKINQFIMNGNYYMRNEISISMTIKKEMSLEGEETALKFRFEGNESPLDIKEKINSKIEAEKSKNPSGKNATDNYVRALDKMPTFMFKFVVSVVKLLDRWNLIPRVALEASPFHSSSFITNLGSIGIDAGFHHIYNFGTVGSFISIGKKGRKVVMKKGQFVEEKMMKIAFVADERICDGYYWASAFKLFFSYLKNPEKLENKN